MKVTKSPMNYLGNKYKLLKEILPLFPEDINNFYDPFCGGLDVSINVTAKNIIANDKNHDLIWLFNEMKRDERDVLSTLEEMEKEYFPMNQHNGKAIRSWQEDKVVFNMLFESKKTSYYKLREDYNNTSLEDKDYLILLSLLINGFGLVEFRSVDGYVTLTCGKGRLNNNHNKTIPIFKSKVEGIEFLNQDFRFLKEVDFSENDFVYLDPPYLNTSQYKDKWSEEDERDMYLLIDYLDSIGVKFALSNFQDGENHTNEYLSRWCSKYNIHTLTDNHHLLNRFDKDNRVEILITNYPI